MGLLPRIPSRPTVAPATATPNQPSTALSQMVKAAPRIGSRLLGQPRRCEPVFEAYFTPYEPAQKAELAALDMPSSLRAAQTRRFIPKVRTLIGSITRSTTCAARRPFVIKRLIEAAGSGVEVSRIVGRGRSDLARAALEYGR